jgi:flagellar assembly protein FliH
MDFQPLSVPAQNSDPIPEQEGAVAFTPFAVAPETNEHQGAFDQGYQAGVELAQGQAQALAAALGQAEQSRQEQARAQAARLETEAASLACQIASSLVDAELSLRPEMVLGVVKGALSDLTEASEAVVELHPEDLEIVEGAPAVSALKLSFRPDASLSRGGCRVHSEVGDIDASRETRLLQMQARIEELSRELFDES